MRSRQNAYFEDLFLIASLWNTLSLFTGVILKDIHKYKLHEHVAASPSSDSLISYVVLNVIAMVIFSPLVMFPYLLALLVSRRGGRIWRGLIVFYAGFIFIDVVREPSLHGFFSLAELYAMVEFLLVWSGFFLMFQIGKPIRASHY